MSEVGFDVPKLTALATSAGGSVPGLGTLDHEISTLRHSASALMEGTVVPSDAGLPTPRSSEIGMGLLDLSAEIKRRLQLIQSMAMANRLGIQVHFDAMALDLVNDAAVKDATDAVKGLLDKDCGMNGNRDDIEGLQRKLEGLNPEELDNVVDGLSDEELKRLGDMVRSTGDSGWTPFDHNGLDRPERFEFFSGFLSRVSPSRIGRIVKAFPEVNPGFDSTDSALDQNAQTGESGVGMQYGDPSGKVWAVDRDGNPVVKASDGEQGSFGDCWFIAAMLSAQGADKNFIPNHMAVNPNGTISVKMYDKDGDPHWTTVTKELPLKSDGTPAGARGTYLWPGYYEKAFAQLYSDDDGGAPDGKGGDSKYDRKETGTYGALEWDFSKNAAPYISGHGADDIGHDFNDARDSFKDGKPVLISTPGKAPDPPDDWGTSYSTRHVYFVKSVSDDTITVGNPWGSSYDDITMTKKQFDTYFQDASAMDKPE